MRSRGMTCRSFVFAARGMRLVMSVSITPTNSALTSTLNFPASRASDFVKPMTPALAAA